MILEKFEIREVKDGLGVKMTMDDKTVWAFPGKQIQALVKDLTVLMGHDLDIQYTTYNGHKRLERINGVF